MRNKLLAAGALAAMLTPGLAMAQADPNCVRSNRTSTGQGAVLGALGGALIGNRLAGRGSRGAGTALGALGGAVAGGAIANGRNQPCPDGYEYQQQPAAAYGPGYAPGPAPAYGPPPPGGGYGGGYWRGAPADVEQRIDFQSQRIDRAYSDGRLSPVAARRARRDLADIRHQRDRLAYRDGGLSGRDRDYLQRRLDHLNQTMHYDERWGY